MPEPRSPLTCEIIAIGNELLIGDVQDTNTFWLIQQLTGLGGLVHRCSVVRDDFDAIAQALRASVAKRTGLIITTGGLGPTSDDLTLAAVASAFGLPLVVHAEVLEMLTKRFAELASRGWVRSPEMTEARRKMAILPQGAEPVYNPAGGAPASMLQIDGSTIVSLPGVPRELKEIFTGALNPALIRLFGGAAYQIRSIIISTHDESFIAGQLQAVVDRHPRVYIKSRSLRTGSGIRIRVTLSTTGPDLAAAERTVDAALLDLRQAMAFLGLTCADTDTA